MMNKVIFSFQLRLDFNMFAISGPSTQVNSEVLLLNGQVVPDPTINNAVGVKASLNTNCQVDSFAVSNPGGTTPPVICGTNTGKHSEYWWQGR